MGCPKPSSRLTTERPYVRKSPANAGLFFDSRTAAGSTAPPRSAMGRKRTCPYPALARCGTPSGRTERVWTRSLTPGRRSEGRRAWRRRQIFRLPHPRLPPITNPNQSRTAVPFPSLRMFGVCFESRADFILAGPHPEKRRPGRLQRSICRSWEPTGRLRELPHSLTVTSTRRFGARQAISWVCGPLGHSFTGSASPSPSEVMRLARIPLAAR